MARAFFADGDGFVALLDREERGVVRRLCQQVLDLVATTGPVPSGGAKGGDPFDEIVAGLGDLADATTDATGDERSGQGSGRGLGLSQDRADQDPALTRLFPTGHREDEAEAAEFRRLTESSLRQRKHAQLALAIEIFADGDGDGTSAGDEVSESEVRVSRAQAPQVLTALTDVRLVLAERLGLRTDEDAESLETMVEELEQDDPAVFIIAVYDFVTWLQESLTQVLLRS